MTIAECVRMNAEKQGLGFKALAKKANLSVRTVEAYWQNRYNPGLKALVAMCKVLKCDVSDILEKCK
jgi:transcriptional regulator with XRE-family HTH domain